MYTGIIKSFKTINKFLESIFFFNTIGLFNKLERPNFKQAIYTAIDTWDKVKKCLIFKI